MESLSLKEEYIIKDIRNLFRLKKELNYFAVKDQWKKNWRNNCIEYETKDEKNKTLSVEEYLHKIIMYLKSHKT